MFIEKSTKKNIIIKKLKKKVDLIFKNTKNKFFKILVKDEYVYFRKDDINNIVLVMSLKEKIITSNFDKFIKSYDKSFLEKLTIELERILLISL